MDYAGFLAHKAQIGTDDGFEPGALSPMLFDFQAALVAWALRKGRAALFADCGLGKTPMQLAWAEAVVRRTNRPVLVLTPLAVAGQTVREAEKFGIEASRSAGGPARGAGLVVTNYERLHHFDRHDFAGVVCDESSILKSFDGARRGEITAFMRHVPYRLLCTATAAPNDTVELGTSSEALGALGHTDMLGRYFKNDAHTVATNRSHGARAAWRFKGHAEAPFWRWVASWARALRRPSDLGFDDETPGRRFTLPPLVEAEHLVAAETLAAGMLLPLPAVGLPAQREERRRTIRERCERVADLVADTGAPALVWCDLNAEGDLLARLIPGAVQVSGADADDVKEERLLAFAGGRDPQARVLVTKPKIGAWGLNFQHCAHVTAFPTHSFESYYQGVRRCWRFGQTRPVRVDVVTTAGEQGVVANLRRKAAAADRMFDALVAHTQGAIAVDRAARRVQSPEVPSWL